MTKKVLLILLTITSFALSVKANNHIPQSVEELLTNDNIRILDTDSVYMYLRQEQQPYESIDTFSLFEGNFNSSPILIYMLKDEKTTKIYACINPYITRYPSSLLLWNYENGIGIRDWFEINENKFITYKLCDFWEKIYIAKQTYEINNGKFKQINSKTIWLDYRDDNPSLSQVQTIEYEDIEF